MATDDAYWTWVRAEAARIFSDGCTLVSDWNLDCCLEHDLACHFGRDPRSAYEAFSRGSSNPWLDAVDLSRRRADVRYGKCNFGRTRNTVGYGRALFRYVGVRIGAFLGIGVRHG